MLIQSSLELLDFIKGNRRLSKIDALLLATSANVSPKFISQLENGKESVEVDTLIKVTRALGIHIPVLDNPVNTGILIKEKRKALGLDQVTGASLCNVSPRFLSTVENGISKKRLNKLFDVLVGFGIEVEVSA